MPPLEVPSRRGRNESVASKFRSHERNEFVDIVHVVDEIRRITSSVGDRLSELYGFDAMDYRWGHPVFTYLAN